MNSGSFDGTNLGNQVGINYGQINFPPERPETPPAPLSTVPFRRDPDFVDRGDLLDEIHVKCSAPGSRVALVGLGGVGKSQLVIEYCYRVRDESPTTWLLWTHATNATRFEQSCREIASRAKIPGFQNPKVDIVRLLSAWLNDPKTGHWVLILDNLDDDEFFHAKLSENPSSTANDQGKTLGRSLWSNLLECLQGTILITSRSRGVASRIVEENDIVPVEPMEERHAISLFEKKLGTQPDGDTEHILQLTAALGFMPLAIVQAALYIKQRTPRYSVKQYLDDFPAKKVILLQHKGGSLRRDEEAQNAILLTLQITFDHLLVTNKSAVDLLSLISFFDIQEIPDSVLREQAKRQEDDWSFNGALDIGSVSNDAEVLNNETNDLNDDTNVPNNDTEDPPEDSRTPFHEVNIRDRMHIRKKLNALLSHYKDISQVRQNTNIEGDHDCNHNAADGWCEESSSANDFEDDVLTLRDYSLISIGVLEKNFRMHRLVQLGMQEWLKTRNQFEKWRECFTACLYRNFPLPKSTRDWAKCEVLYCHIPYGAVFHRPFEGILLRMWESLLYKAALYTYQRRRLGASRRLAEWATFSGHYKIGGITGQITVENAELLGSIWYAQGQWEDAEKAQVRVMRARERTLGRDHPSTLISMTNLILTYKARRKWKEAEELQADELKLCSHVLGPGSLSTLKSMSRLASIYLPQGRLKQAEDLQLEVVEMSKNALGEEHPDTLASMSFLASIYKTQRRFKEAEDLQLEVLDMSKNALGLTHPDTLTRLGALASIYWAQGLWLEAKRLYAQEYMLNYQVLGPEHPSTLTSMGNLALAFKRQGRLVEAKEWQAAQFDLCHRVLEQDHPSSLTSMNNLAHTLASLDNYEGAFIVMTICAQLRDQILGPEHPQTIASKTALDHWAGMRGKPARKMVFGDDNTADRIVYAALGLTSCALLFFFVFLFFPFAFSSIFTLYTIIRHKLGLPCNTILWRAQ